MAYYSKSKYVAFTECNARLWLEKNKPEEKEEIKNEDALITGNEVGDLAMGLFGEYYLAETDPIDIPQMVKNTKDAIDRGVKVIAEAAFIYKNNYCAVDILKVIDSNTLEIYEVKSTSSVKPYHKVDASYQYYVLTGLGYNVTKVSIVHLNNKYIYDGDNLDLNQLFVIEDITKDAIKKSKDVEKNLALSDKILESNDIPNIILSSTCDHYDGCPFKSFCFKHKNVPTKNSVLDLYNTRNRYKLLESGIRTFEDVINNKEDVNGFAERQIDFALNNREPYIDKESIKSFLSNVKYPIYYFDFETYSDAIPTLKNSYVYEQITFQYSLHIDNGDGKLIHKEYLGDGINDPRLGLIKAMLNDLGTFGSIVAYNKSFEMTRIEELARMFPEYKNELLSLNKRFIDLADVFQDGYYYKKEFGGSFSIKSVLPGLFPNDPELDYHNLEDVHKGDEASAAYKSFKNLNGKELESLRNNLLKYCELDTFAMVKIMIHLMDVVK